MNTRRFFLLFSVVLALALLYPSPPPPAAAQNAPALEALRLINELRASLGLTPFTLNASLTAAAQSHAEWMATTMTYTHTGAGGSSPQQRATAAGYAGYVSENIVGGTNLSPQQGVVWWQNSAIHYQTMTSTRHIHAGVGFASNDDQNMYVLVVGVPSDYAPSVSSGQAGAGNTAADLAVQPETPIIVIPVEKAEPREDGAIIHEVQMGQTAWDVAAVYGVDLETLLALNYLPDDPILLPGDEIVVQRGANDGIGDEPLTHIVREGQTAWAIAARYHIPLADLLWLNNLGEDAVIQPGDELIVRLAEGQSPPPTPTPPTTHIIQAGETAWGIAIQYGLTLEELLALNNLTEDAVLQPGEELRIRPLELQPPPTSTPDSAAPTLEPAPLPSATVQPPSTGAPTLAAAPSVTPTALVMTVTATPTAATSMTPLQPSATTSAALPPVTPNSRTTRRTMIGALVIGIGVLALAVLAGGELVVWLRRR